MTAQPLETLHKAMARVAIRQLSDAELAREVERTGKRMRLQQRLYLLLLREQKRRRKAAP
jgi:hypothetical protein